MKIVLVSKEDFEKLWLRLMPQERNHCGELPCMNLCLAHKDMLVLAREGLDIFTYKKPLGQEFTLEHFLNSVRSGA